VAQGRDRNARNALRSQELSLRHEWDAVCLSGPDSDAARVSDTSSAIRNFPLSSSEYTPIIAPIACNYYIIIGNTSGDSMRRSSDGTEANSYLMAAGSWYSAMAPANKSTNQETAPMQTSSSRPPGLGQQKPVTTGPQATTRYRAGQPVTYLKASAGVGPVVVEFLL
jgi:hypothetical protein